VSRPDRTLWIVGFYGDQIVPRVTNLLLASKEFGKMRA
jgi:hypothetical protein